MKSVAFVVMLYEVLLVSVLLQQSNGYDIYGEDKRQGLIPFPRFGRLTPAEYWTIIEEKQSGGMMPYPRLGRGLFYEVMLPQTLIPFPRAGRAPSEIDELYNYEPSESLDDILSDAIVEEAPIAKRRGNIGFTPRIGRRKRSIPDGQSQDDKQKEDSSRSKDVYLDLDDVAYDPDFYQRPDRQYAPRSRNAFIPRVGKKSSETYLDDFDAKRALAFTPRIGRASLIPRIGRGDKSIKIKSRGAFIPRIGRRALIPRVGRSMEESQSTE